MKTAGKIFALAATLALVAFPATGLAKRGEHGKHGKHTEHAKGGKSCTKAHSVGFQVGGTLVSMTADELATTDVNEASVTLTVTSANTHARESGDLADQNADRKGVQANGATLTVPVVAGDAFELRLSSDYGTGAPAAGDRVKVKGRIAVTKKRCADEGTTTADRYGAVDVIRVSIKPAAVEDQPEAPEAPEAPETETPS